MDPLSDVLSLLKPRSTLSAGLDAGGDWAIHFAAPEGIKFNAVMRGACWVAVDGAAEPVRIETGDCFLLTQPRPFTLASDLSLTPIDAGPIYQCTADRMARCNGGGAFFLIGGRFTFAGDHSAMLFSTLPPIVHVRGASAQASVLRWALDQLAGELADRKPGGSMVAEHLAQIMLVQVLRLYLRDREDGVGWLYALSDRQIGAAIAVMHADPAHDWSVEDLGRVAGMSRSTFAEKFRRRVGASPMAYLTRWRMLIAGDRLLDGRENVASIALSLGYESESAFSTAFKRVMACSPRQYRRG